MCENPLIIRQMKQTITIRNADSDDKDYLDSLCLKRGITMPEALSIVVNVAKTAAENNSNIVQLKATIEQLTLQNSSLLADLDKAEKKPAEIVEKPVEKIVEVEKKLTGSQFICTLADHTARNARKVRRWAVADGNAIADDYPNSLVNTAVNYFIGRKYADYID